MSLSSHVLDAMHGRPAHGIRVTWERRRDEGWEFVADAETDEDGRITDWRGHVTVVGTHRLVFDTGEWFRGQGHRSFYPEVVVVFEIVDADAHHHVPLLLSPFAYSTYRGS